MPAGDAGSELSALEKEFYRWHMQQAPEFSTTVGEKAYNDKLMDLSIRVLDCQYLAVLVFLNRTRSINRAGLTRKKQYSYDTLRDTLEAFASNYVWREFGPLNPISFMEAFYLNFDYTVEVTPLDTAKDFENFLSRLETQPAQVNQIISRMQESVRLRTTSHLVSVVSVTFIDKLIRDVPPPYGYAAYAA